MRDSSFVTHVVDLIACVGPARSRAMMGGHTIFCCELPVGLIADDCLYLKVDAQTREAFARAGGEPFRYESRGKVVEMSYWTPPEAALEDPESMRPWATLALEAAQRGKRPRRAASPKPTPRGRQRPPRGGTAHATRGPHNQK